MLRPRWRKVLHDLWDNKVRTLLVVASVAVGVFAIGVIVGTYVLLSEDLSRSYAAVNPANIQLLTDPFDPDFVDTIRRLEGVADAEGRRTATVRVRLGPAAGAGGWDLISLVAIPDYPRARINQLLPRQGASAPQDRGGALPEVILERKSSAKLGVAVGDQLTLELGDGTVRIMRVAGSVQEPTVGYGGILGDLKGFITFDTLEWLHYPLSLDELYITLAERPDDKAHIERMAALVADRLERSGRQVYRTELSQRSKHPLSSIIRALLGVLAILGLLVVFLSGSLIANTMSALLNQHLRQIGVMKLIGGRQRQIAAMYLTLIEAFGLIALLIAIPLGGWGAFALAGFAADVVNFVLRAPPPIPVVPLAVLFQAAVALPVPIGAGMLPVLRGTRVTVQRAISSGMASEGPRNGRARSAGARSAGARSAGAKQGRLARFVQRGRWPSRPLRISLRNTFRRKGRLALTLFTLTLAGAVFIAVFNTQAALDHKVTENARYFQADVNLDFAQPYRVERVTQEAMAVPGVERVEAWLATSAELLGRTGQPSPQGTGAPAAEGDRAAEGGKAAVSIIAPPADSALVEPILLQGRWLLPSDRNALAVNEAFWAEYPDLGPGDVLRLKVDGDEGSWTVVGVFQYTGADTLIAYANYAHMARELNQVHQASMYRLVTAEHSLEYQSRTSARLERRLRDLGYRVATVEAGKAFAESITDVLGILTVVLLAMALLTALVGSIGLTGTMSMNVLERTREIGVMRAIGADNPIVSGLVIAEGLIIGLISFALGGVLSFPITSLLSNVISLSIFNSPAQFAFTGQGFGIWLGLVILLSVGASLLPARNATRLTIREVLAYE